MTDLDLTTYDAEQLDRLRVAVAAEQERRYLLATAEKRADEFSRDVLAAKGRHEGQPWVQPTGAHDAYPREWIVEHNGRQWESLTPANVWEPGASGWREVTIDENAPPEWVQPTGAHDAYSKGARVTFDGSTWESLIDGNVWSPTGYPAGWARVE